MAKPVVIPNVFASEGTGTPNNIPLLDQDFSVLAAYANDGAYCNTRGVDSGTVNNYAVTLPAGFVPSQYAQAMRLVFNPLNSNTGPATINVNTLGSQIITTASGATLNGGEIVANQDCDLMYDGTNFRIMSSVSLPQIWNVRLRSFNAVGNPNFETTQRNIGGGVTIANTNLFTEDRWFGCAPGTGISILAQDNVQTAGSNAVLLPGTNFPISKAIFRITLNAQKTTLAATDAIYLMQYVEGPIFRELSTDVHSISILVRSSVAGFSFGIALRDLASAHSLTLLGAITAANSWTLLTFPNLPIWTPGGTFSLAAGIAGYTLAITLAAGSSLTGYANGTWQNVGAVGAAGQSNFAANPVNSTFDIAMVQHEPGALCSQLMDKPFSQNLSECFRYYEKTYDYGTAVGAITPNNAFGTWAAATNTLMNMGRRFKTSMAKVPTMTFYNYNTGAAGGVYTQAGNATIGTVNQITAEMPFATLAGLGGAGVPANTYGWVHYTADTGW